MVLRSSSGLVVWTAVFGQVALVYRFMPELCWPRPARQKGAAEQQSCFVDLLTMLLHDELESRAQSNLRLRLRRAAFDPIKRLTISPSASIPSNNAQVFDLAACTFHRAPRERSRPRSTGVSKSHLAQALAHEACRWATRSSS
jgi:DNA replication protein DnaC